jgi:hypothetical protein
VLSRGAFAWKTTNQASHASAADRPDRATGDIPHQVREQRSEGPADAEGACEERHPERAEQDRSEWTHRRQGAGAQEEQGSKDGEPHGEEQRSGRAEAGHEGDHRLHQRPHRLLGLLPHQMLHSRDGEEPPDEAEDEAGRVLSEGLAVPGAVNHG